jgi:hypothetical protein
MVAAIPASGNDDLRSRIFGYDHAAGQSEHSGNDNKAKRFHGGASGKNEVAVTLGTAFPQVNPAY